MPLTILAHQWPVLPLKRRFPTWFCGTALVFGSMAPDLEHVLVGAYSEVKFGHSLPGQFLFCLPLSLVLWWTFTRVIAAPLALLMADHPKNPNKWRDYTLVALSSGTPQAWLRAALSAVVGSFSHLGLDQFTNARGWLASIQPWMQATYHLGGQPIGGHVLAQAALTLVLGWWALRMFHEIGRSRSLVKWYGRLPAQGPASVLARRFFLGMLILAAGMALVTAYITAGFDAVLFSPRWWVWGLFRLVGLLYVALLVSAAATSVRWGRLAELQLEPLDPLDGGGPAGGG